MKDLKSVQDLIIKSAFYDGVSTTIRAREMIIGNVLEISFTKGNRCSAAIIELVDTYRDPEEVALYSCKQALYKLLEALYEEIIYPLEEHDD